MAKLTKLLQATESVKETEEEAGWNLEDEAGFDDEEEEQQAQVAEKPAAEPKPEEGAMDLEEGGDEIDPLDAFMADNEAKVGPIKTEEDAAAAAPKGDGHSWAVWLLFTIMHAKYTFFSCARLAHDRKLPYIKHHDCPCGVPLMGHFHVCFHLYCNHKLHITHRAQFALGCSVH